MPNLVAGTLCATKGCENLRRGDRQRLCKDCHNALERARKRAVQDALKAGQAALVEVEILRQELERHGIAVEF